MPRLRCYAKGLDNGYLFTKDNSHNIFKSAYSTTDDDNVMGNSYKIQIDGDTYYFGKGNTCADVNKINNDVNKICTLGNIALSGSGEYYLAVNLPIFQYKDFKDDFREKIFSYNNKKLVFNNQVINYCIKDVLVLPQGYAPIFVINPDRESIIFDIGSQTINIAYIEWVNDKLTFTESVTLHKGLLHLYERIIDEINRRFQVKFKTLKAESIIRKGLYIGDKRMDDNIVRNIIREYMLDIMSDFKTRFSYKTSRICVCGGGAELLYPIFQSNFKDTYKVPNSQFANADGLYLYALEKYSKYVK